MNTKELVKHLASLKDWAGVKAAGRARAAALEAIARGPFEGPIVTVPFGDARGIASADGRLYKPSVSKQGINRFGNIKNPTADDVAEYSLNEQVVRISNRVGWRPDVLSTVIPKGAAPTNKMIGDMRMACGLTIILGAGSVGKTPLAHALAGFGDTEYEIVRYGEPLAGYEHDMEIAAGQMAVAMMQSPDVVLDSVKDVMAMASGAAMKSGIVRAVLPMFTQWSTIAADMGCTLYVPVNPSSSDKDVIELMEEAAKSNSTTMIMAMGQNQWKYLTRGGEGLERQMGDFSTSFSSDGVMVINGQRGASARVGPTVTGTISDEMISATIRRSLNASI